jgi:deazaflavin-dependent oxidoreductase (nitroreductase family)
MRAPVGLYRAGLGFLFGQRMLLLEHRGRRSGRTHRAVLEVVARPGSGRYLVVSGYGRNADWFRNVEATPACRVSVGRRSGCVAEARVLPSTEAVPVLREYARRHAVAWRALRPLLARTVPGLTGDPAQLARHMPLVELTLSSH